MHLLATRVPPRRLFYGTADALDGVTLAAPHYSVYFAKLHLSTDLEYFSDFQRDGKNLLFEVPPDSDSRALFYRLLRTYDVTHVLVSPNFQTPMHDWLSDLP